MCDVLKVSRSGFYAWLRRPESQQAITRRRLSVLIKTIHKESRQTYGSPRIHAELKAGGEACCLNTVARYMRENDIYAKTKRKFKHTREGWLYLATVQDLFSRKIVGWAMSHRIDRRLVIDALRMAVANRRPPPGLLHHSDRGSQYASNDYQDLLEKHDIMCSMSRKGNCWDNAVMESFYRSLKTELIHHEDFQTREEARRAIFEYVEVFYNRLRRHSTLGYVSPLEYEVAL